MTSARENASAQGIHITGTPALPLHFPDGSRDVQASFDSPELLPTPTVAQAERTKPCKASNSTERNMKPCASCRISRQRVCCYNSVTILSKSQLTVSIVHCSPTRSTSV